MSSDDDSEDSEGDSLHVNTDDAKSPLNRPIKLDTIWSSAKHPGTKSGWLFKRGANNRNFKRRYFILRDDSLKYYKDQTAKTPSGVIFIPEARIVTYVDKKSDHAFRLTAPKMNRVYELHAESQDSMKLWIKHILMVVAYFNEIKQDRNKLEHGFGGTLTAEKEALAKKAKEKDFNFDLPLDFRLNAQIKGGLGWWRQDLNLRGLEARLLADSGVVHYDAHDDDESDVTSACLHNKMSTIAIASCSGPGRGNIPEKKQSQNKGFVQILHASGDPVQLKVAQRFRQSGSGIFPCMTWYDNSLLCAAGAGMVFLYKLDPSQPVVSKNASVNPTSAYKHTNVQASISGQGEWLQSTRIRSIASDPNEKKLFVSLANNCFHVWDVNKPEQPLKELVGSSEPLLCVEWNPHNTAKFVMGGVRRSINVVDIRALATSEALSFKVSEAHQEPIRRVAWSPLVDTWLASAGDDGFVKIWDLRYGTRPVVSLDGHLNSVSQVAWSRSHAELLISGGADGTLRLWNIRMAPHYLVHHEEEFVGGVAGAGFSRVDPYEFFGIAADGEVRAVHLSRDLVSRFQPEPQRSRPGSTQSHFQSSFLTSPSFPSSPDSFPSSPARPGRYLLADSPANSPTKGGIALLASPSNYERSPVLTLTQPATSPKAATAALGSNEVLRAQAEKQEAEIKLLLYLRDFQAASIKIAQLTDMYWKQGSQQKAMGLLEHAAPVFSLGYPSCFDAILLANNGRQPFHQLVTELALQLPPQALTLTEVDASARQDVRLLELRIMLTKLTEKGDYEAILAKESEICEKLRQSEGHCFSTSILKRLVGTILPHAPAQGVMFATAIGKTLNELKLFQTRFVDIANVLLSPTVYDKIGGGPESAGESFNARMNRWRQQSAPRQTLPPPLGARRPSVTESLLAEVDQEEVTRKASKSMALRPVQEILESPNPRQSTASSMTRGASRTSVALSRADLEENQSSKNAEIMLDRDLRNPKVVLSQLELLGKVFMALRDDFLGKTASSIDLKWGTSPAGFNPYLQDEKAAPGHDSSDDDEIVERKENPFLERGNLLRLPVFSPDACNAIIAAVDEYAVTLKQDLLRLMPAMAIKMYLNALLLQRKLDTVFIRTTGWLTHLRDFKYGLDFAYLLNQTLEHAAFPLLTQYVEKFGVLDSLKPWRTNKISGAALTLLNIWCNCELLPEYLAKYIPQALAKLSSQLKKAYWNMANNTAYIPKIDAMSDSRKDAQGVLNNLNMIQEQKTKRPEVAKTPEYLAFVALLSSIRNGQLPAD
eukprot:gb/GEZN01000602.1/.p1 GENE.gb/GEZN01000602.1/~~gb/GEZN01000602.1/.p1  ORF type:complete len:1287 (-),score=152.34 gb/GEZN01000602.1/:186-4016(-)